MKVRKFANDDCGEKCNEKYTEMASVCDDAIHEVRRSLRPPQQPRASIGQRTTRANATGKNKEDGYER